MAEIRYKTTRTVSTDSYNDHGYGTSEIPVLSLSYEKDVEYRSLDALVDRDEYNAVKEGDQMCV